jgi:hypothetical protein
VVRSAYSLYNTARPPSSRNCSAVMALNICSSLATRPVQPVWWLAPRPAPLSPWKIQNRM